MGCGGSVMAADGSIAPGKGDARIEMLEEVATLWYWGGEGKKVSVQQKVIPADIKLLKEAKYKTVATGAPGVLKVKAVPSIAQQRYEVEMEAGAVHTTCPGATLMDLCKKVHIAHTKDEKKYPDLMVKAADKKEGHPYKTNKEKAKTDCDALANFANPSQMHDDMVVLKDGLVGMEEGLPGNGFVVTGSVRTAYGTYEENAESKPKLSTSENIQKVKDEQLANPVNLMKVLEPKEKVMNQAVTAGITGLCKGLSMEVSELVPNLDALLAKANGKKPEAGTPFDKLAAYQKKIGEPEKPKPEDVEKERQEKVKAELEADKPAEEAAKTADKDKAALEAAATAKLTSLVEYARAACTPAEESALVKGTRVLARWKVYGWYEGVLDSGVAEGVISERGGKKEEGKYCVVKFDDGDSDRVAISNIALEKADPIKEEDCTPGSIVRANFFESGVWQDGKIKAKNKDGTYVVVFDVAFTEQNVKASNIRPPHDLDLICATPFLVPQSFYPITFTWLQADTDLDVEVRVWREFDEGNVQTCKLQKFTNKKITKDGTDGGTVHGGYKGSLPLWNGRTYCYNFKIGDKYFAGFQNELKGEKGFKRFTVNISA